MSKSVEQQFDESMKTIEFRNYLSNANTAMSHLINTVALILLLASPALLLGLYRAVL